MSKKTTSSLLLLTTAFIWGTSFVAQSVGMDYIRPFTFHSVRSLIGGLSLLPVWLILRRGRPPLSPDRLKATLWGGLFCGLILFFAGSSQQFGIAETTVGKAGFISALYIILVPVIGLFLGRRVRPTIWVAVSLSTLGLYLLCFGAGAAGDSLSMANGDVLILCSAFLFTAHILVIDHYSAKADGVLLSMLQFLVTGAVAFIAMLLFEKPTPTAILAGKWPILYAGVLSSGVAYTLQIIAQKDVKPAVASLILSLEAVFGALAGWIILGERFTPREGLGAALMFGAILLSQLPERKPSGEPQPDVPSDG